MPGVKANRAHKMGGRWSEAAKTKSATKVSIFFEGGDEARLMIPARVVKNQGATFQLAYFNGAAVDDETLRGEPCGTFGARGKIRLKIGVQDVVIVEGSLEDLKKAKAREKSIIFDIIGKLSKKEVQLANRAGLIPSPLIADVVDDGFEFDYESEDDAVSDEEEDEIAANIKRGKVIRARKIVKKEEKATGRGSGGASGRGDVGHVDAKARTKEEMEALEHAAGVVVEDEEEDEALAEMAQCLGVGEEKPKKVKGVKEAVVAPAPAPAPAPSAEDDFDLYQERDDVGIETFDNWEEAADAMPAPAPAPKKAKKKVSFDDEEIDIDAI